MLKNCQNKISAYGCSPITGTKFYSFLNLMKPGSQSGTYIFSGNYFKTSLNCHITSTVRVFDLIPKLRARPLNYHLMYKGDTV